MAGPPPNHKPGPYQNALFDEYIALISQTGASVTSSPEPVIGADDVLVVVDMQNDFVPEQNAPLGGRFGVAEGDSASQNCVKLINLFASKGAKIIATRDYHPKKHCSFNDARPPGPFPEHCLQGSPGAAFYPPIAEALTAVMPSGDVHIVHKGFHEGIDSFGALPYSGVEAVDSGRLSCSDRSCCPVWTGGFELKCSNQENDINAPPDVLSIMVDRRRTMKTVLDEGSKGDPLERRIFVCGLAMDFCCLDTIVNATYAGYKNVHLVMDASRAACIPGVGRFGTGFLTDPKDFTKKAAGSKFVMTGSLS